MNVYSIQLIITVVVWWRFCLN